MILRKDWLDNSPLLLFLLCAAGFTWAVRQDPFFWDTIQLASKHAHFFYDRGGEWAVLPPEIDSGHPPALGYYLAFLWAVFGKNLATGHWAMLPFLLVHRLAVVPPGQKTGRYSMGLLVAPAGTARSCFTRSGGDGQPGYHTGGFLFMQHRRHHRPP